MFEFFLILFLVWMFSTTAMVALLAMVAIGNMDNAPCEYGSRANCASKWCCLPKYNCQHLMSGAGTETANP